MRSRDIAVTEPAFLRPEIGVRGSGDGVGQNNQLRSTAQGNTRAFRFHRAFMRSFVILQPSRDCGGDRRARYESPPARFTESVK